jgi:SAM-dependent methyltransferase
VGVEPSEPLTVEHNVEASGESTAMSHPEQHGFFEAVAAANYDLIAGARVIEIGSYDVRGSIRSLFPQARDYVGVDLSAGPGVDIVGFGHEIDHDDASYDIALSAECFEHDPHWQETFTNMVRLTRPGGLVAFSCAGRGRPEHGTSRTDRTLSPGTQSVGLDYYHNLMAEDFEAALPLSTMFSQWRFWWLNTHFDTYFVGVRAGEAPAASPRAQLPDDDAIALLRTLMPFPHRAARVPLRLMSRVIKEPRYQSAILPYWNTLLKLAPESQR